MSISVHGRQVRLERAQSEVLAQLPATTEKQKPAATIPLFDATPRRFGENFDCTTHAAVIKLMMMTFGQSPSAMLNRLTPSGDGYDVTMKDEFKLHLSEDEVRQASQASRFKGTDPAVVKDANFMFAAFVKRKQLVGGYPTFAAALAKTLEGEPTQRCLQGMGVFGVSQYVSSSDMTAKGATGVMGTHNGGSALIIEGVRHLYGEARKSDQGYGYILFNDKPVPRDDTRAVAPVVPVAIDATPAQIWDGFYQGVEGNCVTVSAIKAALIRFWQDPQGIYKSVEPTADGFRVVMRDSYALQVSHDEIRQATAASNFYGTNPALIKQANFLYAVSAKRAQLEDNDFRAAKSFQAALESLNDGEYPGEALRRLGLFGYVRESTVDELAKGAIGTLADNSHSVAVINGVLDFYGQKQALVSSRWMNAGFRALKLV